MSHFTVAVFSDGTKSVDELLARYDENISVPEYVRETKEQIIKRLRDSQQFYKEKGCYAQWLKNPEEYERDHGMHEAHINYIKNEFPKELEATDEELYQKEISRYEPENIDENGSILSTYNPDSKWDYHVDGDRWGECLKLKSGKSVASGKVKDILFEDDFETFAVVLPDGSWHQRAEMGWWAMTSNEDENWSTYYKPEFIDKADPEWTLTIVDCHI